MIVDLRYKVTNIILVAAFISVLHYTLGKMSGLGGKRKLFSIIPLNLFFSTLKHYNSVPLKDISRQSNRAEDSLIYHKMRSDGCEWTGELRYKQVRSKNNYLYIYLFMFKVQ